MKIYGLTAMIGLAMAMNGCATPGNGTKSQMGVQRVNPQVQAFSGLGDITPTEKGFKVDLNGDSLFKVGHSHLSQDGIRKVDGIADVLLKYPGDLVVVLEYTDNSGTDAKNLKISQRRADAIKKELVKQGVHSENVTTIGKGDADPVAPNDTPGDMAKNRRVEFEVITS
jgi:outer membrane protein OmpA-like peptidoglycan-associated protein